MQHGGWQRLRYAYLKVTPILKKQPYCISKVSTSEFNGVSSKPVIDTSNHVCHKVQNNTTSTNHNGCCRIYPLEVFLQEMNNIFVQ